MTADTKLMSAYEQEALPAHDEKRNRQTTASVEKNGNDSPREAVFEVREVSKIYRMGEIEVRARLL